MSDTALALLGMFVGWVLGIPIIYYLAKKGIL